MSKRVKVDFQGIAVECEIILQQVSQHLCKLQQSLDRVAQGASRFSSEQTQAVEKELKHMIASVERELTEVVALAKANSTLGVVTTDLDFDRENRQRVALLQKAQELQRKSDHYGSTGLAQVEGLYRHLMNESIQQTLQQARPSQDAQKREGFLTQLATIEDSIYAQYIYLEWLQDDNASFEILRKRGEVEMSQKTSTFIAFNREQQRATWKEELQRAGVTSAKVEEILQGEGTIETVQQHVTQEIIEETKRKKTLAIIKSAIEERGFIIPKGGIKLQREKDEVVLVAQKPHGEQVDFRISLHGQFIYHFDGYKGQSCQEDITPFMNDLEEIYGLQVTQTQELWSNPDRVQEKKQQVQQVKKRENN